MTAPRPLARDIEIKRVSASDVERIVAFLSEEGYSHAVDAEDRHYAAESLSTRAILATGRLSVAQGVIVLCGMRVRRDCQRQAIGRELLSAIVRDLGPTACYCIPYRWLTGFYRAAGFRQISASRVPAFLAERQAKYLARGSDVILMYRPALPENIGTTG